MRAVIQRVSKAEVNIEQKTSRVIGNGFVVLLGIEHSDTKEDAEWLSKKIIGLRVFSDTEGQMNLNISDVTGNIILVSQFTLHAKTKKGNRPSFIQAAKPEIAKPLYDYTIQCFEKLMGHQIETGEFGAMMDITLTNNGPVTILMDSKNKE